MSPSYSAMPHLSIPLRPLSPSILDVGTDVYLHARQYCMEGLREFTAFTNKWKGMEDETVGLFEQAVKKDVRTSIKLATQHGTKVRGRSNAKKYAANLPVPEVRNP